MKQEAPFAGLGKMYFCRVEDKDKEPVPLGEPITIKPGMLTYKDDEPKSEYSAKGFSTTFTGTMQEPSRELVEMLNRPTLWDVKLQREPGKMPRKMKKAVRASYRRDTKWKRKAMNYLSRLCHTLHNAEIVVTREQQDRLAQHIEMTISPVDAHAEVSQEKIDRLLRKYSDENRIHGCHDCPHWQHGDDGGQCEYADCPICDD